MKVHNVTVDCSDIGWHGIGQATVTATTDTHATIDISTWVDEDGIGESAGGIPVEKRFPSTIVLLDDPYLDTEAHARCAETAYIGTCGTHDCDTYRARFEDAPPTGDYDAFFPHTTAHKSDDQTESATLEPVDYSKDEVVDLVISQ